MELHIEISKKKKKKKFVFLKNINHRADSIH